MKLVMAIDGACRRNGKPDCTSSGGVFIQQFDDNNNRVACNILSAYEYNSTNQRGELLALLKALDYACTADMETFIITDSEYIFNAMTKHWYDNWQFNGWLTRAGEPIKNKDIWMEIARVAKKCEDPVFYHVKGHCIPFGTATANDALKADTSGAFLHSLALKKFDDVTPKKQKVFDAALELSERNNGFVPSMKIFKDWVTANVVADAIATKVVDAADQRS